MQANLDISRLQAIAQRSGINAAKIVQKLAQDCQAEIVNNFSPDSPSSPGDTPGVVTGNLKATTVAKQGDDALTWVVNVGAPYGLELEYGTVNMAARPFVRPAFERTIANAPKELFAGIVK